MQPSYVYIMTGPSRVLYTGVTSNLSKRVGQHHEKRARCFTQKYNLTILIYFETFFDIRAAIAREKQIKAWRRSKKIALIESKNPRWKELTGILLGLDEEPELEGTSF
jgi:putative endonuclease